MGTLHTHRCIYMGAGWSPAPNVKVCPQQNPRLLGLNSEHRKRHSRREALLSLASIMLTAPACAVTSTSPFEDAKTMQYGLDNERSVSWPCKLCDHCFALVRCCGETDEVVTFCDLQPHTYMSWCCEPKLCEYKKPEPGRQVTFCTLRSSR